MVCRFARKRFQCSLQSGYQNCRFQLNALRSSNSICAKKLDDILQLAHVSGPTLATTNINPLPAKQQSVHRTPSRSQHDQAHPERREYKVHARSAPSRKAKPNFDHRLQSTRYRRPQSGHKQTSDADLNVCYIKAVLRRAKQLRGGANQQGNGSG
jgi:hypothetical protein